MRLLITGASGLLGMTLGIQAAGDHPVTGLVHHHPLVDAPFTTIAADLTRRGEIERVLDQVQPEVVIHCAAIARPDDCEKDPELTQVVNAWLPGQVAAAAARRQVRLVHISTEAIFDGQKGGYTENDEPNPLNVYARSKLTGEQRVLEAFPEALVARVIFYGWSATGERSLAEWFFNNLSRGNRIKGFTDAVFCPLLVNDLADILVEMIGLNLTGIYHVASSESISKYDFGVGIARRFCLDESLIAPASVQDSGLAARRSTNLSLRTDKLVKALGRPLPSQQAGLERFYELYRDGYRETIKRLGGKDHGN